MALNTARRAGLVEQVIEQLRGSVADGEWPVGHRIPNESDLVEALGVGRNTVREAVRALAHAGLFEVRQGDGTYVRATSEVSGALSRLCNVDLRDVLQVRRGLEVEGARLAAANRTDDDIATLRALLEGRDNEQRAGHHDEFVHADTEFHCAVMRASRNTMLIDLYLGIIEAVTASVNVMNESPVEDVLQDHHTLLDHIVAGEPELAAQTAAVLFDRLLAGLPE
ncbi:FadR family transcriptional regulator [Mycobacterium sp. CBMA293]|uniref:FadR/GntR family transcriptional regulator n=1 Tax=unclassified Mycolicibacterium TaxID=2636767 RepID=UPI001326B3B6|nr:MULTISPECIES: FadR/GntR family transcriptional regulator [unclassified Mycolicibacterium]MUL44657.1 FadR family transcriptional regulator [Mycolicibacterium sp. CBMA 360]MUL93785.1 FadR family transcriptional regulator [Mycolicibacterium sp. CBMA 230]MUM31157.1 FadR family transcriptional regulator [Mycolicibacterium sp. CBMA 361]MUL59981.1 FadR family transcriptional regulator [Mycolicibacterium sp. CBMA 335]MUL68824.1 FadR family transcriptional regulator [Mycolicibacterium sp. CBMA 311]